MFCLESRRFKSEFQVIGVTKDHSFQKTYRCLSKVDQQNYLVHKTFFPNHEQKNRFLKLINIFSKIYHKNVLRYYNTWVQIPKISPKNLKFSLENFQTYTNISCSFSEIDTVFPNKTENSIESSEINTNALIPRFYFQTESQIGTLFEYCSQCRKIFIEIKNEDFFLKSLLRIYEQLIEGISELFNFGLRQKNLLDFNNIFLNENQQIKLGNLKDLDIISDECAKDFEKKILRDIEAITYKLFFEENPINKTGKRNEVLEKIEDFFIKKVKGKNMDELAANMKELFQEIKRFVQFLLIKEDEIILGAFAYKQENTSEWKEKLFSFSIEELRCYRDKRDKKPEKIFDLNDFEVKFEEKGQGIISIKNPLQIGCFIRGANRQETKQVFQKIVSMRGN